MHKSWKQRCFQIRLFFRLYIYIYIYAVFVCVCMCVLTHGTSEFGTKKQSKTKLDTFEEKEIAKKKMKA